MKIIQFVSGTNDNKLILSLTIKSIDPNNLYSSILHEYIEDHLPNNLKSILKYIIIIIILKMHWH